MLADQIRIARRFQRAIRVDVDFGETDALQGFICSRSSQEVLRSFTQQVQEDSQGAFTWTGPFGCGKSSMAVVFASLFSHDEQVRNKAASVLGRRVANQVWKVLPVSEKGWHVLPLVGRRDRPEQVIGEELEVAGYASLGRLKVWKEKQVLDILKALSQDHSASDGLLLIVDEMGKFLEFATSEGSDINLFQQIAELASRSKRRFIFIGILHQSFGEYAHRLSHEMRDEWSKIQGRFSDLAISISSSEQIELISRTIKYRPISRPKAFENLACRVAAQVPKVSESKFANTLANCWPLNPVTACLLGPMSRRRFGQSQRSIFGFLSSAEPKGFQDFLKEAGMENLYAPADLWDYLRVNLEPSILASSDGHRWGLAIDAIERCAVKEEDGLHLQLLKTIAILNMLKDSSGLLASNATLSLALRNHRPEKIDKALKELQAWSLIVYRKFTKSYAIFEGSDFDIDRAVAHFLERTEEISFSQLNAFTQLQPVVAKRHYHETGALRWFDIVITTLSEVEEMVKEHIPRNSAVGTFFVVVASPQREKSKKAAEKCQQIVNRMGKKWETVIGLSPHSRNISVQAKELWALERVRDEMPELFGDRVARAEVYARIEATRGRLEGQLEQMLNNVQWYVSGLSRRDELSRETLNSFASQLAGKIFDKAPHLHNELLGRAKPSSSATAGMNNLLRRMVSNEGDARLGIKGFPTEAGLFVSLLEDTKLYRKTHKRGLRFAVPASGRRNDPRHLGPTLRAARKLLKRRATETVSVEEIYALWRNPPFGVKEGLLPILLVAFYLSCRESLAFYREGIFQVRVSDLDLDVLTASPKDIQLRWMNLSESSRKLLSDLADIVRDIGQESDVAELEPIDVARGLIAIFDQSHDWVGRTQRLSRNAKQVRQLFKSAKDPNKLIFDDIPRVFGAGFSHGTTNYSPLIESKIREGLVELRQAYSSMLGRLKDVLLSELQVSNSSSSMLFELRSRAENVREVGGDHRLESFVMRISNFNGEEEEVEGLASMAINKPSRGWTDVDTDRAKLELSKMARQFIQLEAFSHVNGRADKRHALALVAGMVGEQRLLHGEFDIADMDRGLVDKLVGNLNAVIEEENGIQRNVILAALTELSAQYLDSAQFGEEREP